MKARWIALGIGAACGAALATLVVRRSQPAPVSLIPPSVEVFGMAEFPEALDPFTGATLQVRLVDLTSPDSAGLLIASSTFMAAPRAMRQAWNLRVPADRARFAEDAYFVVSLNDHKGVRFIGSGFPREFANSPRRGTPSAKWLDIRLAAVPAPAP